MLKNCYFGEMLVWSVVKCCVKFWSAVCSRCQGRLKSFFIVQHNFWNIFQEINDWFIKNQAFSPSYGLAVPPPLTPQASVSPPIGPNGGRSHTPMRVRGGGTQFVRLDRNSGTLYTLWFSSSSAPCPLLRSASCLSSSVCLWPVLWVADQTYRLERGWGDGREPNHTTARKPGPL